MNRATQERREGGGWVLVVLTKSCPQCPSVYETTSNPPTHPPCERQRYKLNIKEVSAIIAQIFSQRVADGGVEGGGGVGNKLSHNGKKGQAGSWGVGRKGTRG